MSRRVDRWILHPDEVVGVLSNVAHALRPRSRNTTGALRGYEGVGVDALFAAPAETPADVRIRRRWRLGGVSSEDVSFPSDCR